MGLGGLQAGYKSSSKSKDSTRIDLRPQMWQLTSMAVCFGLVLAVVGRVVGGGDFGRFVVFLALLRA